MPGFSVFQDFVAFKFSGKPTRGESIYKALVAAEAGAFDLTPGTYEEARLYATAMGLARARYALERAQNQTDPLKAIELLPQLEHDWGVVPREVDGIVARQRRVAAAFLLAKGALLRAMETALRSILGTDFLALVPMDPTLATVDESLGLFTNPKLPFKLVRISPVTATGIPFVVDYVNADVTSAPVAIDVDDMLVVEPENTGLQEVVTVTAVDTIGKTFTATFAHAHDDQSFASTQNYVPWTSTQCSLMVVAKAASALDAEARRLVNEFMEKVCRGVWTWSIVEPTTPGAATVGPFALDFSPLGAVPLGSFPFFYIPVAPPFDPATLNLTRWFRGDYPGDPNPWVGTPSAGISGSNNATTLGSSTPAQGPALNGHVPLLSTTGSVTCSFIDTVYGTDTGSMVALVKPLSADPDQPATIFCPNLFTGVYATACMIQAAYTDAGFRASHYDTVNSVYDETPAIVSAVGAYHMVVCVCDGPGGTMRMSVDGSPLASCSVAIASGQSITGNGMTVGSAYITDFNGDLEEHATTALVWDDTDVANWKSYFNARYGLSL